VQSRSERARHHRSEQNPAALGSVPEAKGASHAAIAAAIPEIAILMLNSATGKPTPALLQR